MQRKDGQAVKAVENSSGGYHRLQSREENFIALRTILERPNAITRHTYGARILDSYEISGDYDHYSVQLLPCENGDDWSGNEMYAPLEMILPDINLMNKKSFVAADEVREMDDLVLGYFIRIYDLWMKDKVPSTFGVKKIRYWKSRFEKLEKAVEANRYRAAEILTMEEREEREEWIKRMKEAIRKVGYRLSWLQDYHLIERYDFVEEDGDEIKRIYLMNEDYRREVVSYDHIVIGRNGVFVIKDRISPDFVIINENDNWTQLKKGEGIKGIRNPGEQTDCMIKVLRSILPDEIPVTGIICFADDETVIHGINNSRTPVVKGDQIVRFIEEYPCEKEIPEPLML